MKMRRRIRPAGPSLRRARGKVIPFSRPTPSSSATAPEHLQRGTEASLRATDVYVRLLHDRLELARRTTGQDPLGRLDGPALLHVAAVSDALQRAAEDALAQIEPQLAMRARLVAETAREVVLG